MEKDKITAHGVNNIHGLFAFALQEGVITVNEFRDKGLGLDATEDGRQALAPYSLAQTKARQQSR